MDGKEIIIDTEEIAARLYTELWARGYFANQEECEEIADIVFDYLLEVSAIDEIEE